MDKLLRKLNPEQRAAVTTTEGPLLVLAGAGSGKTRVVTTRIAYLMHQGVPARKILAVTFTNKAANEMRERAARLAGSSVEDATMCTFHSLGLEIVRTEARSAGRRRPFAILDQNDQLGVIRELMRRIHGGRAFDAAAILDRISRAKNAFLGPEQLPDPKDEYDEMTQVLYPAYLETLRALAALDFDDLICEPVRLLEGSETVRRRWQTRYRYLHVDEYQDTNAAQLRLTSLLADHHRNLCVVGDDDQSIYGWRGADVRNILEFEHNFPDATVVKLERNYRSTARILEAANAVIAKNPERHAKRLRSTRGEGDRVVVVTTPNAQEEATFVSREIKSLRSAGRRPRDIAILFRASNLTKAFEETLREAEIPFRVSGGSPFYARKEVKDALAYLKILVDPRDELALRRIVNYPARGIGPVTLEAATKLAEARSMPLLRALKILPGDSGGPRAAREFVSLVEQTRREIRGQPLAPVADRLFTRIGLREEIAASTNSGPAAQRRWGGVLDLLRSIRTYETRNDRPQLAQFINLLMLRSTGDEDEAEAGRDEVTLSTLHAAKGLEFPVVFLVAFEEDILPHLRTLTAQAQDATSGDLGEERRLCYVAITRAKDTLYITRSVLRAQRGANTTRSPSRFLADIPEELLEVRSVEDLEESRRERNLDQARAALKTLFG